jgi:hypothetical protein
MNEIVVSEKHSGRCCCHKCGERIKDGTKLVRVISGQYKGHINYSGYHSDCFLWEMVGLLPEIFNIEKMNQIKKEMMLRELDND